MTFFIKSYDFSYYQVLDIWSRYVDHISVKKLGMYEKNHIKYKKKFVAFLKKIVERKPLISEEC